MGPKLGDSWTISENGDLGPAPKVICYSPSLGGLSAGFGLARRSAIEAQGTRRELQIEEA